MRKKGKPNPDQRYFQMVVALQAHCGSDIHMIAAHASERIIVRASNPGQFESDVEVIWNKGKTSDSIYHAGRVGVNTDSPEEAMTIHGNLKVTGHIISPSDMRAKEDFQELDTKEQLENISKMKVYKYSFREEFAEYAGLSEDERTETGVIAQEISRILPDAVRDTGDVLLPGGERINNFLVVNKDRLFIENVGAVKELCKVTDQLEDRIVKIEYINTKLAKMNKSKIQNGSVISSSSISASISSSVSRADSRLSAASTLTPKTALTNQSRRNHNRPIREESQSAIAAGPGESKLCTNRNIQLTIIVLVVVMFVCLMSMTTLYLIDRKVSGPETSALVAITGPPLDNYSTRNYPPPMVPPHCLIVPQDCPAVCSCGPKPTTPVTQKTGRQDDPQNGGYSSSSFPVVSFSHMPDVSRSSATTKSPNEIPDLPSADVTVSPVITKTTKSDKLDNGTKRNKTMSVKDKTDNSVLAKMRARREVNLESSVAKVYFKQLNDTVSRSYCTNPGCVTDSGGNYSYSIPISPMFPRLFLTLKFLMTDPSLVINLCAQSKQQSCSATETYDFAASQMNSLEWDLPAGYFVQSYYMFRIGSMSDNVCDRPNSEAGVKFAEYSFGFYRVCSY